MYQTNKMKFLSIVLIAFTLLIFSKQTYAQGCSDAGVCSVGSLGLAQFKYEKLPIDKVKLEEIEEQDVEEYTSDFKAKKTAKDSIAITTRTEQRDTIVRNKLAPESAAFNNSDSLISKDNLLAQSMFQSPKYVIMYSESYGLGDQSTSIVTSQIEATVTVLSKKLYAQVKLPYVFASGNLGSANGAGDLTMSLSYVALNKKKTNLSFVGGVKIPTGNSDLSNNKKPLPMVYQPSLGTTDALFGFNYRYSKWDFTVGYQHSFNANKNGYLHTLVAEDKTYNGYFESKNIKRADDGVFRINRSYAIKKVTASTGLLFIYHLANDKYDDVLGNRVTSKGSQGLTLNLNFSSIIPLSKKTDLVLIFAAPVKTRDARPDGLTREFVVSAGLRFNIF